MKKFIRIISPITILVVLALDSAVIAFSVYAIKRLMQETSTTLILFAVILLIAIIVAVFTTKEALSNGVKFKDDEVEFTGLDTNNIFKYCDIQEVESKKDTQASLKKNFVDRYSHIILHMKDESVVTIDLGLTTQKTLNKIVSQIKSKM